MWFSTLVTHCHTEHTPVHCKCVCMYCMHLCELNVRFIDLTCWMFLLGVSGAVLITWRSLIWAICWEWLVFLTFLNPEYCRCNWHRHQWPESSTHTNTVSASTNTHIIWNIFKEASHRLCIIMILPGYKMCFTAAKSKSCTLIGLNIMW